MATPGTDEPIVDGRRARAERGRQAAIDAMLELVREQRGAPTAEQVAERAGLSTASVYRYFESLAELQQEMAVRYFALHADLFVLSNEGRGPLPDRIDALVAARIRLYDTIAPVSRLGRSRAVDNPALDEQLRGSRRLLADQVGRHFAPELAGATPASRDDLASLVSSLVSIEAWEHQRDVLDRTDRQIARAWRRGLRLLLAPPPT